MLVTVDSRAAGKGKTTTLIYPKIQKHLALNEKVLLVVPSIILQQKYEEKFPLSGFITLNSKDEDRDKNPINVTQRLLSLMTSDVFNCICITHQAWLKTQIPLAIKNEWHLIIDEAITPFRTFSYWRKKDSDIDWSAMCELDKEAIKEDNEVFYSVKFNEQDDSLARQIKSLRDLSSPLWDTSLRMNSYHKLQNKEQGRAEFIQELKVSHMSGYKSVHIAAAAFKYSFMGYWLKKHRDVFDVVELHPFSKLDLPIKIHAPEQVKWSSLLQRNRPDILQKFDLYVASSTAGLVIDDVLSVKNSFNENEVELETYISNNPHGLNELSHYQAVSLKTALIPSNEMYLWLSQEWGMSKGEVHRAFSSYVFYQIIMRTALRNYNNKEVHVYLLDYNTLIGLADFFLINPDKNLFIIDVGYSSKPMTGAERKRKSLAKKKAQRK